MPDPSDDVIVENAQTTKCARYMRGGGKGIIAVIKTVMRPIHHSMGIPPLAFRGRSRGGGGVGGGGGGGGGVMPPFAGKMASFPTQTLPAQ